MDLVIWFLIITFTYDSRCLHLFYLFLRLKKYIRQALICFTGLFFFLSGGTFVSCSEEEDCPLPDTVVVHDTITTINVDTILCAWTADTMIIAGVDTGRGIRYRYAGQWLYGINQNYIYHYLDLNGDMYNETSFLIIHQNYITFDFNSIVAYSPYSIKSSALSGNYADTISPGAVISLSSNWDLGNNELISCQTPVGGTPACTGLFEPSSERIIGLRFYEPPRYYFGWVRVIVGPNADSIFIKDYAFTIQYCL